MFKLGYVLLDVSERCDVSSLPQSGMIDLNPTGTINMH